MRAEAFVWFIRGIGLAAGLAVVLAIGSGVVAASRVLILVLVSILLASGLEPMIGWARTHLRLARGATILVVYMAFFAAVLGIAVLVVPNAINEFGDLGPKLQNVLADARTWAAGLQPKALSTSLVALIDEAKRTLSTSKAPDPGVIVEAGLTVADALISLVTMLAIVFFWLTEHARLQRSSLSFLPASRRGSARDAWNSIEVRLGSWVRGQLILMAVMGVAMGITYTVLGLDAAILLGLIAAIAEAIPIVGPLIGAIPALLVAATVSPQMVLIVAGVYIVVQILEGNVLVPLVMRNTIGLSPFLVIVSILAGAAIGGIVGALLAVPVVAAVEVLLERLQARDQAVALDPSSAATPDAEARPAATDSLPDSRGSTA